MQVSFTGQIIEWRGPAPFYWVPLPEAESQEIKQIASLLSYGWGVIPVTVQLKSKSWTTSLMPQNGQYLVPIRNDVRLPLKLQLGESVEINLEFK